MAITIKELRTEFRADIEPLRKGLSLINSLLHSSSIRFERLRTSARAATETITTFSASAYLSRLRHALAPIRGSIDSLADYSRLAGFAAPSNLSSTVNLGGVNIASQRPIDTWVVRNNIIPALQRELNRRPFYFGAQTYRSSKRFRPSKFY